MAGSGLQPTVIALTVAPAILSTFIVVVRFWRRMVDQKFAIEDWLLALAQILIIGLTITTWVYVKKAYYGYHVYDIPKGALTPDVKVEANKWTYANAVIYNPILGLIKASFVLTLIKLRSANIWINRSLWFIFVINGLFTVTAPILCAFQCNPVAKQWDVSLPGKCLDPGKYVISTISIVLVTDIMVVVMPTWILYGLQIPLKRKIMIICFLSFGVAVTGIGAYRLSVFVDAYVKKIVRKDPTYSVRIVTSNLESNLAVIGACGATVKWLLGTFIPFFESDDTRKSSKYTPNTSGFSRPERRKYTKDGTNITMQDDDYYYMSKSAENMDGEAMEMRRTLPGWRNTHYHTEADADSKSDEQRITGDLAHGITKMLDWEVRNSTPALHSSKAMNEPYAPTAVQPRNVI
ncbi:hypothetical protein K469DRAFT_673874 [Zopfia rhizophila CBS 207.26]|uniref:Rhodopsin domain-containing protein n=1 Tax=Zopfia rhizophila CBS 207.26 TaxID=1314779 RepID=A0A6A6DQ08_9PEZI|nr:hypothetical protein K469DRAFT_673874 [Zopfia rhizophila CBS 207.26]